MRGIVITPTTSNTYIIHPYANQVMTPVVNAQKDFHLQWNTAITFKLRSICSILTSHAPIEAMVFKVYKNARTLPASPQFAERRRTLELALLIRSHILSQRTILYYWDLLPPFSRVPRFKELSIFRTSRVFYLTYLSN